MRSRLNINYITALQALGARAQGRVSAVIGPNSSENNFQMTKNGPCGYLKTAHFELDLLVQEHENEIPPVYKLHQGPPSTWYEGAGKSFSGYRS